MNTAVQFLRVRIALLVLLLIAVFYPVFQWMNVRFSDPESFYAHGYLVPFVAGYLVFLKWGQLSKLPCGSHRFGLAILLAGLLLHLGAQFFEINFLSGIMLIPVLYGLILYNCGRLIARRILFPLLFLLFMVPLPNALLMGVSFYLKIIAANCAAALMGTFIPLRQSGSLIYFPNGVLTVGAPCSGLKSMIALSALSLLFAYLGEFNARKKFLFFLLALPVAFAANILRIMLLIFVYFVYGVDAAMGKFHDFSGLAVFVFAFIGLVFLRKVFLLWHEKSAV